MGNRKFVRMPDGPNGSLRFAQTTPNDVYSDSFLGGCFVKVHGEASAEEIARMKEKVVEDVCNEIRKIANERDDFFIVKVGKDFISCDEIVTTVAAKYLLPTVKDNM